MSESFPLLTELNEDVRTKAMQRFAFLKPHLEQGVPLVQLAQSQQVALRTARRWLAQYRKNGLVGLSRKPRQDQGKHRSFNPQLQQLIEALALQRPQPTTAQIYRQVQQLAAQHNWQLPTYRTVCGLVQHLEPALVTLAQQGSKVYAEQFDLIYRREADQPNQIWQADHCLLDIWVLGEQGQALKPWLSVIIDDYSRAIAGYQFSFQAPSALRTALTLRQAIWYKSDPRWHVCGIPEIFYTDHGSDFTSKHMEQVSADLKIQLIFSQVGVPRGRGRIERFFETVNQLFLAKLPGYSPPGTPAAPAKLTLAELENQFHQFIMEDYHLREHSAIALAPQRRWEESNFLPQMPASLEQLDLLLLTVVQTRQVHPDGIHFQGLRYLDTILAAYVGEAVTIRYDPRDMAEIRVYHEEKFVCRAVCQELAAHTISLKEIVAARTHRRHQLRERLAEHTSVIDTLLEAHQVQSELATLSIKQAEDEASTLTPRLKRYYNE